MNRNSIKICFVFLLLCFFVTLSSMAFAVEVANLDAFKTACLDSSVGEIKFASDITITDSDYNNSYIIAVEDVDRTLDLNGHNLIIEKDLGSEYGLEIIFKDSYRGFTITNSSASSGLINNNSTQNPIKVIVNDGCSYDSLILRDLAIITKTSGNVLSINNGDTMGLYIDNVSMKNSSCVGSQSVFSDNVWEVGVQDFTYDRNGNNCYFQFAGSDLLINNSLSGESKVYYYGDLGRIRQFYADDATLSNILLLSSNHDFDIVEIKAIDFSNTENVSTYDELYEALQTPEITIINVDADITVDSEKDFIVNVNGENREVNLNGHTINILNDEYFKVYYWTVNDLTFTDNNYSEHGSICTGNVSNASSLFYLYNKNNLEGFGIIFEKVNYSTTTPYFLLGCQGLNLNYKSGNFGTAAYLFYFDYITNIDIEIGEIDLYNSTTNESSFNAFTSGSSLGSNLTSGYIVDTGRVFIVDEDDYGNRAYTEVTETHKLYDTCSWAQHIVVLKDVNVPVDYDLPLITNIQCNASTGIATWDAFPEVSEYYFSIYTYGGFIDGDKVSYNLREVCTNCGWPEGTYTFKISALDAVRNQISREVECTYNFVPDFPRLDTPTNLSWDGYTARWEEVTNAENYDVFIYEDDSSYQSFSVNTENNYYDFSTDNRLAYGKSYKFTVSANANGRPTSLNSETSSAVDGWFELGELSNVSISSAGVISWDAYPGANDYSWSIGTGGGLIDDTSINLKDFCQTSDYSSGTYTVSIYARDENRVTISEVWQGEYTYEAYKLGDMNEDNNLTIVDVRLLLQAVINGSTSEKILQLGDFNVDGQLNIVDVRLLLQTVING